MHTPKARTNSSEMPQRKSPVNTPRTARMLKTPNSDSDSLSSSPNPARKSLKDRSPKVIEHRSPQSPITEKKRSSKVQELESQISQLQEDLKKSKDQLNSSELWKRKAQQEAEAAKKQLLALSKELEESNQQLMDLSASEEARLQELHKISQDRDRAWQSELEAVQKQQSMDSAALLSAMNEIHKLKTQLERVDSEATQSNNKDAAHAEIQDLRMELANALSVVENLKNEVSDCRVVESRALELVGKMQMQLETANNTMEALRADGMKATEEYESVASELEQSRTQIKSLEGLVSILEANLVSGANKIILGPTDEQGHVWENGEVEEINRLKAELSSVQSEVEQLKSALDASEIRFQEEYIQSTLQIRSAYEQLERSKSESGQREAELSEELRRATAAAEELKANLMEKESWLRSISQENEGLNSRIKENQTREREFELAMELKKLDADIADLKAKILDRDTELQTITAENCMLKMEIKKELEKNRITEEAVATAEAAKVAEKEALIKLDYITEEVDKSKLRVARVTEQLDAAQVMNLELEAELRRLKVQSDQWRKAAEAAASMLASGNNNGKFVERNGSLDCSFNSVTGRLSTTYLEDTDEESPKKKSSLRKRIGVLWRKNHQ
ncbi:interactor of constitutive active ROPs 2, chloroplastic-like [Arachis stenosperma]|uniref:interactor of constitutive active ROPs 2, chloroplastic-like n=1 Tax=Arachis stenosperma TaxID=217475 RepID=UPI0025AB659C|nr:interactor of constitutive active ROPs 2, chloroplastic-like [Arachis stenosperma]XP_057722166.1 interactor of constitutive active ROPs 2, chloroplastic-like [Arachis stenosperma]